MSKTDRVMRELLPHLEATRLPFAVVKGGRHRKVILGGKFIATVPYCDGNAGHYGARSMKNVIATIKRAAKEVRAGSDQQHE